MSAENIIVEWVPEAYPYEVTLSTTTLSSNPAIQPLRWKQYLTFHLIQRNMQVQWTAKLQLQHSFDHPSLPSQLFLKSYTIFYNKRSPQLQSM
jgi:hypothetical protein